jgi:hypothetical protein
MKLFVVIDPALGWDNVVGIFSAKQFSKEELYEHFPSDIYIITDREIDTDLGF